MPGSRSQQYPWKNAPFIRVLLPFVGGIIWSDIHGLEHRLTIELTLAGSVFLLVFFNITVHRFGYSARWLAGILVNVLLFYLGQLLFLCHEVREDIKWFGHQLDHAVAVAGKPVSLAEPGNKSAKFQFECSSIIYATGKESKTRGMINIYAPPELIKTFLPGDTWMINAYTVKPLTPSDNPGSFDFARYCFRNQIFHQAFIDLPHCHLLRKGHRFNLRNFIAAGRLSAMNTVRSTMPEETWGLAMALLIGYRQEMDKELMKTYTDTGVIHVIAVSGMHLGLMFLLMQNILKFTESRYPFTRWTNSFLILTVIWWFSAVAGSAASIVRAAAMFTFSLVARLTRRPCQGIHSLYLFAFVLLCYRPSWLWDAGFRLSFLALLGIFLFQPALERIFSINNLILKHIWQLCSATLAAQLMTLPISIYLFHQSPLYFLPANLWAVPLSNLGLIISLIQWLASTAGFSFTWAGSLAHLLLVTMNAGIRHISGLPMAVISDLNWRLSETILLYLVIFCIAGWRFFKAGKLVITSLVLGCVIAGLQLKARMAQVKQKILVVYQLQGKSITDLVNGQTATRIGNVYDHPVPTGAEKLFGINYVHYSSSRLLRTGRILVAIPHHDQEIAPLLTLNPSFIVITGRTSDPAKWGLPLSGNIICILDGSITEKKAALLERVLRQARIHVHNTWSAGAFQKDLNKLPRMP